MRAVRLVLAAVLCLATASVAAASPGPHRPEVVTRTYQIQMILSGGYHTESIFRDLDQDGFCPGTGQVLDATFHVVGTAKLRVKLDTDASRHRRLDVVDNGDDDWTMDLSTVAIGDECSQLQNFACSGITSVGDERGPESFAYAQGAGHKIIFGTELSGAPYVVDKVGDCQNTADYYPGPRFSGLSDALFPYASASMAVNLVKLEGLKKGHSISKTFRPINVPDYYDVATCDGVDNGECTGALSSFTHTLTIKRVG